MIKIVIFAALIMAAPAAAFAQDTGDYSHGDYNFSPEYDHGYDIYGDSNNYNNDEYPEYVRGRTGSMRVGGWGSHGRGSHYVGGH